MHTRLILTFLLLTLFSACTTQKVRLSAALQGSVRSRPVARLDVSGPKSGQLVFTFEDVTQGGTLVSSSPISGTTSISVPRGMKRADFKYYLDDDSAKAFQMALGRLFPIDPSSPRSASLHFAFDYSNVERDWRGFVGNQRDVIAIRMKADLCIAKDGTTTFQRKYEATAKRLSANLMVTYPSNDTMNGLFNDALASIIRQIDASAIQ